MLRLLHATAPRWRGPAAADAIASRCTHMSPQVAIGALYCGGISTVQDFPLVVMQRLGSVDCSRSQPFYLLNAAHGGDMTVRRKRCSIYQMV